MARPKRRKISEHPCTDDASSRPNQAFEKHTTLGNTQTNKQTKYCDLYLIHERYTYKKKCEIQNIKNNPKNLTSKHQFFSLV